MPTSSGKLYPKDYAWLVKAAQKQGWTLSRSGGSHTKLTSPKGYSTPIPDKCTNIGIWKKIERRLVEHGVRCERHI